MVRHDAPRSDFAGRLVPITCTDYSCGLVLWMSWLAYLTDLRWSRCPSRSSWGCIRSPKAFSQVGSGLEVVA